MDRHTTKRARALLLALALALLTAACGPAPTGRGRSVPPAPQAQTARNTSAAKPGTPPAPAPARPPAARRASLPAFGHIFVIVMENLGYSNAIKLPYIASLARRYAVATDYHAVAHPSLPNYLALAAGHTFVHSDCFFCYQNAPNLASQLAAAHIPWGAYMQSLPSRCWTGPLWVGGYAGKHNPFRYFTDVRSSRSLACGIRPLRSLPAALREGGGALPRFVWITPDLCDDMHSCPPAVGDRWLSGFVPRILASRAWRDGGVLFLTWDEAGGGDNSACCGLAHGGGHVLTLVIAPGLPAGLRVSVPYDHYSLLRTIEAAWGLSYLGQAGSPDTRAMTAFWKRAAPTVAHKG